MQATTPTPGATGVIVLPDAGRTDMLARAGLSGSAHWSGVERRPRHSDDLTEADPWGDSGWDDPADAERALEELGFIVEGGWSVATVSEGGGRSGGMTSHAVNQYAILSPGEYVNTRVLQSEFEAALGFTFDEVRSVYVQGPKSVEKLALRGRIDARFLAISRAGGNMAELGRLLAFKFDEDDGCQTIKRALRRAEAAEDAEVAA